MIEAYAKAIAFAGRDRNDVSEDATEFWTYTGDTEKARYRKMASAALAPILGEPDGWIWEDEFTCEREVYETWVEAGRKPTPFYFSPAASPAPLPVAVKTAPTCTGCKDMNGDMLYLGDIVRYNIEGPHTKVEYWNPEYEIIWEAPTFTLKHIGGGKHGGDAQFILRCGGGNGDLQRIRSALSSPVGGTEEQTGLDANGDFVDIVADLRKVAKIETGLLYSRRLMLNQAASDIATLREIKAAAELYVASVNGEPEKDCWDTEDGKEAPGAERFASDWAWKAYDDAKQKAFDDLRSALSQQEEAAR